MPAVLEWIQSGGGEEQFLGFLDIGTIENVDMVVLTGLR